MKVWLSSPVTLRTILGMAAVIVVLQVVQILIALDVNKLSCQRSDTVRVSQRGYQQYAIDATLARSTAARLTNLRAKLPGTPAMAAAINHKLALNDAWAAAHFHHDVPGRLIPLLACGGVFPDNP